MNATRRRLSGTHADCDALDRVVAGIVIGCGAACAWPQLHWLLAVLAGA